MSPREASTHRPLRTVSLLLHRMGMLHPLDALPDCIGRRIEYYFCLCAQHYSGLSTRAVPAVQCVEKSFKDDMAYFYFLIKNSGWL